MDNIRISVNQERLISVLKNSFSTGSTFIGELLQNARRAGAKHIGIDAEETETGLRVVINDDGHGIEDWNDLISIAQSGWDPTLVEDEGAFGIGFLSALFAAQTIRVRSNGRELMCATQALLNMENVAIRPDADGPRCGTTITLSGVKMSQSVFRQRLGELVRGFPVPVTHAGKVLIRDHAFDSIGAFEPTPVGTIHLGRLEGHMGCAKVYLQGLPIRIEDKWSHLTAPSGTVVHLDPARYVGRLPDREVVVGAKQCREDVTQAIKAQTKRHLTRIKGDVDGQTFAAYFPALQYCHSEYLLNNVPWLPKYAIRYLTRNHDGVLVSNQPENWWEFTETVLSRDELRGQAKAIISRELADACRENADSDCLGGDAYVPLSMAYLCEIKTAVLKTTLDANHWIYQDLVDDSTAFHPERLQVSPVGETKTAWVPVSSITLALTVCQAIRIDGPLGSVEIDDWVIHDPQTGTDYAGSKIDDDAIGALIVYGEGDDNINYELWRREGGLMAGIVRAAYQSGDHAVIEHILCSSQIGHSGTFNNRAFNVRFDDRGVPVVTVA